MNTITVYYQNIALDIGEDVAVKHGLNNNSRIISEAKYWEVLGDSCKANMAFCQKKIAEKQLLEGVEKWLQDAEVTSL